MLGGGGGVRTLGGESSPVSGVFGAPPGSGSGFAGRERTGGGGGPDERPKGPGAADGGADCREGSGGGPPGNGVPSAGVAPPSVLAAFGGGEVAGGGGVTPVGVMPGCVVRAACGGADVPGRGGENAGRGATAAPGLGAPGPSSLGFCLSFIPVLLRAPP